MLGLRSPFFRVLQKTRFIFLKLEFSENLEKHHVLVVLVRVRHLNVHNSSRQKSIPGAPQKCLPPFALPAHTPRCTRPSRPRLASGRLHGGARINSRLMRRCANPGKFTSKADNFRMTSPLVRESPCFACGRVGFGSRTKNGGQQICVCRRAYLDKFHLARPHEP